MLPVPVLNNPRLPIPEFSEPIPVRLFPTSPIPMLLVPVLANPIFATPMFAKPTLPLPALPNPTLPIPGSAPRPELPNPKFPSPKLPKPTLPSPRLPNPRFGAPKFPAPRLRPPTLPAPRLKSPTLAKPRLTPPTLPKPSTLSGLRCRSSAIALSMMLGPPEPPEPESLVSISSRPSYDNPDTCWPRLPSPEITAGTPVPSELTLNRPEIPVPELSKPETSVPALPTPETAPNSDPGAWFNHPDTFEPKFPIPDPPPPPKLKKPDDGMVVEFPKPRVAGMSIIEMSIGPAWARTSKSNGIAAKVVRGIDSAGISNDKLIGSESAIEIPSTIDAGISIGGISIGIVSPTEIASRVMGSMTRSSGAFIAGIVDAKLKGPNVPPKKSGIAGILTKKGNRLIVRFDRVMGPKLKAPVMSSADRRVVAGAVKPTLAAPSMPMRIAGMGISGTAKA
ncbi:hypothetical protein MSIMFI_05589 [Mycobacterium simulans]|nr:hypothetical protein MSIMFI_05589 [Mycobacterium simulans]